MLVCAQVGDFNYNYDCDLTHVIMYHQVAAKIELQQGKAVWVPSGGAAVW